MGEPIEPPLRARDRVELREAAYGYGAGSVGVVASTASDGKVLVRFEGVGHAVFVDSALLRRVTA
jgi:hypothetical protein